MIERNPVPTVVRHRRHVFGDWFGAATRAMTRRAVAARRTGVVVGVNYIPGRWRWAIDRVAGNTWPFVSVEVGRSAHLQFDVRRDRRPKFVAVEPGTHEIVVRAWPPEPRAAVVDVPSDGVVAVRLRQDTLAGHQRTPTISTKRWSTAGGRRGREGAGQVDRIVIDASLATNVSRWFRPRLVVMVRRVPGADLPADTYYRGPGGRVVLQGPFAAGTIVTLNTGFGSSLGMDLHPVEIEIDRDADELFVTYRSRLMLVNLWWRPPLVSHSYRSDPHSSDS